MHIAIINNCPPTTAIGIYTFSLHSALIELSKNIKLFTWGGGFCDRLLGRKHPLNRLGIALRILGQSAFYVRIPRNYDLFHFTKQTLGINTRWFNPCVITVHDLIDIVFCQAKTDLILKECLKNLKYANRIICISKHTKYALKHHLNIDPSVVRVVYYGVNHELFRVRPKANIRKMLGLPLNKMYLLNVGCESERKNIPTLIKAFYRLQAELPNLVLIRIGEKSEKIHRLINQYKLNDKVLYIGKLPHEKVPLFYNAADLLCFPSYYEGFGFPPLEAMASGCPVTASNRTSIPEVVGAGGILVDPFNVDDFVYHMREVLTDEDLREKMIERGLTRSKAFSWKKCAEETLKVYEELL